MPQIEFVRDDCNGCVYSFWSVSSIVRPRFSLRSDLVKMKAKESQPTFRATTTDATSSLIEFGENSLRGRRDDRPTQRPRLRKLMLGGVSSEKHLTVCSSTQTQHIRISVFSHLQHIYAWVCVCMTKMVFYKKPEHVQCFSVNKMLK